MGNRIFLLCRSTEKVYAQRMLDKGSIFFNYPINWIKKAQEERREGQGDLLEGVYAEDTTENRKLRSGYEQSDEVGGKIYLRSKDIVNNWLCTCFYSVSDCTLAKQKDGTLESNMTKDYASSFNKGYEHEPLQKLPDYEKMEMVVIKDPDVFLQKVRKHFDNNNLIENEDYFMRLVAYRKEDDPFRPIEEKPCELFSKRECFKLQQEYRIALNTEKPKVQDLLNGGQEIFVGNLDDCACIKPFFYDGASISIDLNEDEMHISRWEALSGLPLHKWKFEHLRDILGASFIYIVTCTLDGRKVNGSMLRDEIVKVLSSKYRILCNFDRNASQEVMITLLRGYDSFETIQKNEEEDLYYYLRKKQHVYEAPTFGEIEVMWPSGIVRFPHIVYQDELTTSVKPAIGTGDGIP